MTYNFKDDMTPRPLKEHRWHWKSVLVYVATFMYAIDIPIQLAILNDTWSVIGSLMIVVILGSESYLRFTKQRTWFGAKFAPVFSAILIVSLPLLYLFMLV